MGNQVVVTDATFYDVEQTWLSILQYIPAHCQVMIVYSSLFVRRDGFLKRDEVERNREGEGWME